MLSIPYLFYLSAQSYSRFRSDLYKLICNLNFAKHHNSQYRKIDMVSKIQIALQLRGTADWQFKFRPQHIIHDELCMILQHRAFCLTEAGAIEIPLHACNPHLNDSHVTVHELAFGPDDDTSVRGVSLWFNIDESAVTEFTSAQAKRFRWKRNLKKDENGDKNKNKVPTIFDMALDGFEMIRPHDPDSFNLTTKILEHRLGVAQAERIGYVSQRHTTLQRLEERKKVLHQRFDALKRNWISWGWPVNVGRKKIDRNTPVPKVDGKYEFEEAGSHSNDGDDGADIGSETKHVWSCFVSEKFEDENNNVSFSACIAQQNSRSSSRSQLTDIALPRTARRFRNRPVRVGHE